MKKTDQARQLPARIRPLMWTHLALTRDKRQFHSWKKQIERILQSEAVDRELDPEVKALLADPKAWSQIRGTGKFGAAFVMSLGALWMSFLVPLYAIGHGFGWLATAAFLLPVPVAWRFARRLWEKGAVRGMRELGRRPTPHLRARTAMRAVQRAFGAGFGFGFTLVFLQALMTWFMTPAATIGQEILLDGIHAALAGTVTGTFSMLLAPLLARQSPALLEEPSPLQLEP